MLIRESLSFLMLSRVKFVDRLTFYSNCREFCVLMLVLPLRFVPSDPFGGDFILLRFRIASLCA